MATEEKMKIDERYQYLQRMQRRYRQANRSEKRVLLDEMVTHTGMHRKALIRRLGSAVKRRPRTREREKTYGPEVDAALALIWKRVTTCVRNACSRTWSVWQNYWRTTANSRCRPA